MNVTYMDHMGSDLTVVNAARVSFDKESDWDYKCVNGHDKCWGIGDSSCPYCEPKLDSRDTKLINYLAEHHHWLPFRHPTVMFRCKAPIFVARQAFKHEKGLVLTEMDASWSEVSRRYVDSPPEFYKLEWRQRAESKKQGSEDYLATYRDPKPYCEDWDLPEGRYTFEELCLAYYNHALESGVAPEVARCRLPQSMYTEWVWTGTLLAWTHFVKQRTEEHAQKEIQEFASLFIPHLERLYPVSWKALMNEYNP